MIKRTLLALSSLRLTIVLIALAMLLVYAGTWAQIDNGLWQVQEKYFHSFFTWINLQVMLPRPAAGQAGVVGGFPMLGGYSVGLLLLLNVVASLMVRAVYKWERIGLLLTHGALILLLVGEATSSVWRAEGQMVIREGESANYSEDARAAELAIIDPSPADYDEVAVIAAGRLARQDTIHHGRLPFDVRVEQYFSSSEVVKGDQPLVFAGGQPRGAAAEGYRINGRAQTNDAASAYVTLSADGKPLGTYLVSVLIDPQTVMVGDKAYIIQLRHKRDYKPYSIQLKKFTHDRYVGTDTPKNFSSTVRLIDPAHNVDRDPIVIWMNHPLSYGGETFYQSSFLPNDSGTVLQVVRNPAWIMPYIACVVGGAGMVIHFGLHLVGFLRGRQRQPAGKPMSQDTPAAKPAGRTADLVAPLAMFGLCVVYLLAVVFRPASSSKDEYDLAAFGRLLVSYEGRTQPLDSVARNSLRIISTRQTFEDGGHTQPAIAWLIDAWARPEVAAGMKVFRIDNPDLLSLINLDTSRKYFAIKEVLPNAAKLNEQARRATMVDAKQRDPFQKSVMGLIERATFTDELTQFEGLYLVPPLSSGEQWQTLTQAAKTAKQTNVMHPAADKFLRIMAAYQQRKPAEFRAAVAEYRMLLGEKLARPVHLASCEVAFNRMEPFVQCMALYVLVFILATLSWLFWQRPLGRAALVVMALALVVHTLGLAARVYIQGRPPVTNLYSSAVFIAWGAVVFALVLELIIPAGIGSVTGATIGFLSLLIAHNLAGEGDTMKMLMAVLDTNFWLATHVVVITLGYSAAFLAGFLGIIYVIRGIFSRSLTGELGDALFRMIYGIICFAMLFSFVGTILGGIWADQSWGRFWGWDPKENGALMLILWNALVLHALWAKVVDQRGVALLAIGGNIITSWAWFGTNMLGVGLHSYGFMDTALMYLLLFVVSQMALIGLGCIPRAWWRSHLAEPAEQPVRAGR